MTLVLYADSPVSAVPPVISYRYLTCMLVVAPAILWPFRNLLHMGATRVYSEYWTCNRLTFHSREQIICSVLDDQLRPGFDRYLPYRYVVNADLHPTYVFPLGSKQVDVLKRQMLVSSVHYKRYIFEGYAVYRVIS